MKKTICELFPIVNEEYQNLDCKFGSLTKYASWQLLKKNAKNNHTDEFDDINQELLMSIVRAGSYYKRQVYIEKCFAVIKRHAVDGFLLFVLRELEKLWHNRTRHGANRQKFGFHQEMLLEKLVNACVPREKRPNRNQLLKVDSKFITYAKAIIWNAQKSMGRKITREKSIRTGLTSLSEFEYIGNLCKE